jgi:peptide/nickel transport system ATP-binding protein
MPESRVFEGRSAQGQAGPTSASAPPIDSLLDVRDLVVEYQAPTGNVRVVDRVSFTIGKGEVLGLAGESGSGKSTIAQALVRILPPPALIAGGSVRFADRDVLAMDAEALRRFRWSHVALVMQSASSALNPVLTVGDQIVDALRAHRAISKQEARARAADVLDRVGVGASRLGRYPHQLSGGMRQRVGIAMALALEPALLILDEPTTALDVVVQREILDELRSLQQRLGFAVLFISHDLGLLVELADRIAVLYAGSVVEEGPAAELWSQPGHPYTQGLLRSVPTLHGPRVPITGVPGSPPDPRALPSGCRFHPRCGRAVATCHGVAPPLVHLGGAVGAHDVTCHLP